MLELLTVLFTEMGRGKRIVSWFKKHFFGKNPFRRRKKGSRVVKKCSVNDIVSYECGYTAKPCMHKQGQEL
jgi:hypothetical protein